MKVRLRIEGAAAGAVDEIAIGPTGALLDAVVETGSLRAAAERLGVSYRSAWGQAAALERALGRAVVIKTKGHGSALTPFGEAFRAALADALGPLAPAVAEAEKTLQSRLGALFGAAPRPLRLAASHDPLLLGVIEKLAGVELAVAGSVDALARLASGAADVAGFHFGAERGPPPPPLDAAIRGFAVRPLFRREQGLMVARGNPLALGSIADIAQKRARFVNRQRGAGTRIWFERLCAEQGVRTERIAGFQTEEFTHQAVGALIASGAADVGMGTRSVAEAFALDYRPLGWETYFLAVRDTAEPAAIGALVEAVRIAASATGGYAAPHQSSG